MKHHPSCPEATSPSAARAVLEQLPEAPWARASSPPVADRVRVEPVRYCVGAMDPGEPQPSWRDLAMLRDSTGLSQLELAIVFGSSEGRIARFERGTLAPLPFEAEAYKALDAAIAPMVNEEDRHRWAREVLAVADSQGFWMAVGTMLAAARRWRDAAEARDFLALAEEGDG